MTWNGGVEHSDLRQAHSISACLSGKNTLVARTTLPRAQEQPKRATTRQIFFSQLTKDRFLDWYSSNFHDFEKSERTKNHFWAFKIWDNNNRIRTMQRNIFKIYFPCLHNFELKISEIYYPNSKSKAFYDFLFISCFQKSPFKLMTIELRPFKEIFSKCDFLFTKL